MKNNVTRRDFALNLGMGGLGAVMLSAQNINGDPKSQRQHKPYRTQKGYTPHIGTLVSMLDWIRDTVFRYHPNLSVAQLDHLHDKDSNTIGALIMHLAATEVIYQDITFENLDDFSPANKEKWSVAMDLGEKARNEIKGNPLSFYRDMYEEVRTKTNAGLDKRDDNWLLSGETKDWDWNNYCKWFHVVEHYANHRGQITWQAKRLPS
ncbi:MAG: DUF664 domain-containing protein [Saprospiraceae bacterium]|nr:DUF664 domain-containing protein [Saprospiraceae bacterium]